MFGKVISEIAFGDLKAIFEGGVQVRVLDDEIERVLWDEPHISRWDVMYLMLNTTDYFTAWYCDTSDLDAISQEEWKEAEDFLLKVLEIIPPRNFLELFSSHSLDELFGERRKNA